MTRTVPGSGAIIRPEFNSVFGVRAIFVENGGDGYDANDPPKLTIQNAGTPLREAVLRPIIQDNRILAVEILDPGEGYDPLRLKIESTDPGNLGARGKVFLNATGGIDYIQMTTLGDNYFDGTSAVIEGGGGSGSELVPVTGGVTGLVITREGRNYDLNDANVVISGGGGGDGATGTVTPNQFGKVTSITLTNQGEFFETAPIVQIIGGGGRGAAASADIDLGAITSIDLSNQGNGYTNSPKVIFARDTNLIRRQRNRQSLNSVVYNLTGLISDVAPSDSTINVETTAAYPGSGKFLVGKEIVRYTGKTATSFTGLDRGVNFRFDQKVTLDNLQDDAQGVSQYSFAVTDQVKRFVASATSRVAIVYDWDPIAHELYLTFEVDELAFIDGGNSADKTASIQFVGGSAQSSGTGVSPHVIIDSPGNDIVTFTDPLSAILNKAFEDDDELDGVGDGIIDLVNTGTEYENDTNLDGGIASSKYGIEEELGGQNITLFQAADKLYDGANPPQLATVVTAGVLGDGDTHLSLGAIAVRDRNASAYAVDEIITGQSSGVTATFVSITAGERTGEFILNVKNITASNTASKFAAGETIQGQGSGATGVHIFTEYTTRVRNEDD